MYFGWRCFSKWSRAPLFIKSLNPRNNGLFPSLSLFLFHQFSKIDFVVWLWVDSVISNDYRAMGSKICSGSIAMFAFIFHFSVQLHLTTNCILAFLCVSAVALKMMNVHSRHSYRTLFHSHINPYACKRLFVFVHL